MVLAAEEVLARQKPGVLLALLLQPQLDPPWHAQRSLRQSTLPLVPQLPLTHKLPLVPQLPLAQLLPLAQ